MNDEEELTPVLVQDGVAVAVDTGEDPRVAYIQALTHLANEVALKAEREHQAKTGGPNRQQYKATVSKMRAAGKLRPKRRRSLARKTSD